MPLLTLPFFFAVAACRDRILFAESPHASSLAVSDAELVRELTRMVLAYLGAAPIVGQALDPNP